MRLSPRKIGIVGPGALGGMIGLLLHRAGYEVSALARPDKAADIRRKGVTLVSEGQTYTEKLVASADPADLGPQDLLIIPLKAAGLPWAVAQLPALSQPHTPWVFIMNGVPWWFFDRLDGPLRGARLPALDPDGLLAARIPEQRVVWGVINCSVDIRPDGTLQHNAMKDVTLGRADGAMSALPETATVFAEAGYKAEATARIHDAIWAKLIVNAVFNPLTALTGAASDVIMADPFLRRLAIAVTDEVRAVGAVLGLPGGPAGEARFAPDRTYTAMKSSMLTDVARGRAIELEPILGAVVEAARRLDIPVPAAGALYGLLRVRAQAAGLG